MREKFYRKDWEKEWEKKTDFERKIFEEKLWNKDCERKIVRKIESETSKKKAHRDVKRNFLQFSAVQKNGLWKDKWMDQQTDGPTDWQTDGAAYRVAYTRLKKCYWFSHKTDAPVSIEDQGSSWGQVSDLVSRSSLPKSCPTWKSRSPIDRRKSRGRRGYCSTDEAVYRPRLTSTIGTDLFRAIRVQARY